MPVLTINGEAKNFSHEEFPATLAVLSKSLNLNSATIIAEVDGSIVKGKDFDTFNLEDGSTIELVQFVGGG
jgi:thiamine biosynthesis protein ThiS